MGNKNPCVLFLSHGGGPLPLLGDEGHLEMVKNLKYLTSKMNKPSAIIGLGSNVGHLQSVQKLTQKYLPYY